MTIAHIQWHTYRLPLRHPFATAHGALTVRTGAIVTVITRAGVTGIGEIAPVPGFSTKSLPDMLASIPTLAVPLRGMRLDAALALLSARSAAGSIPPPIACGLEMALLDALGKVQGHSVSALLAPTGCVPRPAVPVNAVVTAPETATAMAEAQQAVAHGFTCTKLKVGLSKSTATEVARVAAVRTAIGPHTHLRLDANEAWNLDQALAILTACMPYAIQYVEQPLPAGDLHGMRTLRQTIPIPIAADEALSTLTSARHILDQEAADILVIKPQQAGGLLASRRIIQEAAARGIHCVITAAIETGVGLAAALHLAAASPEIVFACGLATNHILADDLIREDLPIDNGHLSIPQGPGLGITLDSEALHAYT